MSCRHAPLPAILAAGACLPSCHSLVELQVEVELLRASDQAGPRYGVVYFDAVGNPGLDPVSTFFLYPVETVLDVVEAPGLMQAGGSRVRWGWGGVVLAVVLPGLNLRSHGLKGPSPFLPRSIAVDEACWSALEGEGRAAAAAAAIGVDPTTIDDVQLLPAAEQPAQR